MTTSKTIATFAIALCLCLSLFPSFGQDKVKNTFGKVTPADFNLPASPVIDSNTTSVILSDVGDVHYVGNKYDWFSRVYTRQTRIKILNKTAIDIATVKLILRGQSIAAEKLSDVSATTFNLENGHVTAIKIDPKDIFENKLSKERTQVKFSLPAVKEGSIIEYAYTITSVYWDDMPSWRFQWVGAPCLLSEYKVEIPEFISFAVLRQGVHPFDLNEASIGHANYRVSSEGGYNQSATNDNSLFVTTNTSKRAWAMKNVAGFENEPFLTTPVNYVDRIDFQLTSSRKKAESFAHNSSWARATAALLTFREFGGALDEDNLRVNELADKINTNDGDRLAQAKAVFYYISHHFTCTEYYPYLTATFQDVIGKGGGSVGDINLLLNAVLRRKGFYADPVLLSTRENGFNIASYAVLDRLNYVIVRIILDGNIYYLDATHSELGFGQLTEDCYNGPARIISKSDPGPINFAADSLKESNTTMVLLSGTDKGIEGSWQSVLGPETSYSLRREVAKQGQEQYLKDSRTRFGENEEISNGAIDSLDKPELPVKLHFDVLMKQELGASLIYFSPLIGAGWRKNPFEAADRKYPIELPHAIDELYILSMDLPQGYTVDELPTSVRLALDGDQGQFEYLVANEGDKIQLRCRLRINKAWFPAEDYGSIRDFFAFVVKKEAEQIVLKRK